MTDMPVLPIMFTTFNRTEYAVRTMQAAKKNIQYEGTIVWYIADAGSHTDHILALSSALGEPYYGHSEAFSPGQNWNFAIKRIYEKHDIYLRLEDDFELLYELDLSRYVRLLMTTERVGTVRLGLMPDGLELASIGHTTPTKIGNDQDIYLNVLKTRQYCYSGHPALIHKRFHEAYGYYPEDRDPGLCETDFDSKVRRATGPEIWMPYDMGRFGTWGCFGHIGTERSYT